MICSAQISLYPLRQAHLGPAIESVRATFAAHGLQAEVGSMSTVVVGDAGTIFAALADAFDKAAQSGQAVMTVTVSNACPIERQPADRRRE